MAAGKRAGNPARKGPYSCFYGPWLAECARAGVSGTQYQILLKLCQFLHFDERGRTYGSCPRKQLADELGLSENTVKQATARMVKKGVLGIKRPGYRGYVTEYWIFPGVPWPKCKGKGVHTNTPNGAKGVSTGIPMGVHTDTPTLKGTNANAPLYEPARPRC